MTRSRHALVSAAVILALFVTGCAKQPAVTQAAAPPPTGAPVAAAPAPPVAAAPEPAPPVVTARPAPKEFAPEPQLADIYFDFDKSGIRHGAAAVLRAQRGVLEPQPARAFRPEGGVARADRKRLHGMTWLQPGWKDFVALPPAGIRRALSGREHPAPCAGPCRISDPHPTG